MALRNRLLQSFEKAVTLRDQNARKALLNVIVVGGGAAGFFPQIVQSRDAVSIFYDTGQGQGWQRVIPTDSRPHLPSSIKQRFGDSRGRWEGDTLVVDTVGFHPERGVTAIPGGGYRTATSRLAERYRLVDGGGVLSVVFTWTDPSMFRTPHSYEFRYYRLPSNYEARTWLPCDPYNEIRAKFLEG